MIQVTVTFVDKDNGACGIEYKINNDHGTEGENVAALACLGLLNVFFANPDENQFLTTEQGERVRNEIEKIVKSVNSHPQ